MSGVLADIVKDVKACKIVPSCYTIKTVSTFRLFFKIYFIDYAINLSHVFLSFIPLHPVYSPYFFLIFLFFYVALPQLTLGSTVFPTPFPMEVSIH